MLGRGVHLWTQGQGQRQSDLTSGPEQETEGTIKPYLNGKVEFAAHHEETLASFRPALPVTLGQEVPLPIQAACCLSFPACG